MTSGKMTGVEKRYHMKLNESYKLRDVIKENIQPWPDDNKWWMYINGYSDERVLDEAHKYINPRLNIKHVRTVRRAACGHLHTSRLRSAAKIRNKQAQRAAKAANGMGVDSTTLTRIENMFQTISSKIGMVEDVVDRVTTIENTLAERSTKVNATLNHLEAEIGKIKKFPIPINRA